VNAGFQLERLAFGPDTLTCPGVSLVLVEHGELRAYLAPGEPGRLAEADVLVLGPREAAGLSARRSGAVGVVFRAQGEWLARALALAGLEPESAPLRAATLRAGTHAARRAALCLRALAASAREPLGEAPLAEAVHALELLAIAVAAGAQLQTQAPRQRRSVARLALGEALETLAREPSSGLTLSRLAERLGLSERQASRLVRERLGSSLGDHVTDLRVARAKRLLVESDLAVIDVAVNAGFGSLGHFSQVFRLRSGTTPSTFRAAARQRAAAETIARTQPPVPGGGALACGSADARLTRASLRSSRFTIESIQAERGTRPS
jgi:AraC-like DNA-binding protein